MGRSRPHMDGKENARGGPTNRPPPRAPFYLSRPGAKVSSEGPGSRGQGTATAGKRPGIEARGSGVGNRESGIGGGGGPARPGLGEGSGEGRRKAVRGQHAVLPPPRRTHAMARSRPLPEIENIQVRMERPHLRDIPHYEMPAGFRMRTMTPEEAPLWTEVQREAEWLGTIGDGLFLEEFGSDLPAISQRCFLLVEEGGRAVGTTSSWYSE